MTSEGSPVTTVEALLARLWSNHMDYTKVEGFLEYGEGEVSLVEDFDDKNDNTRRTRTPVDPHFFQELLKMGYIQGFPDELAPGSEVRFKITEKGNQAYIEQAGANVEQKELPTIFPHYQRA